MRPRLTNKANVRSAIAVWMALSSPLLAQADNISRPAVVKFNTVCTRCHEGECSGRLSFSSGPSATQGHIWRYFPEATPADASELYAILKYVKVNCAHYPLPDSVPIKGEWGAEALRQWQNPSGDNYFVPLGKLTKGRHELSLGFERAAEGNLRVSNEKFDILLEERLCRSKTFRLLLPVTVEATYYLHLDADAPLLEMTLHPAPSGR